MKIFPRIDEIRSAIATIVTGESVSVTSVRVTVPVLDGTVRPDLMHLFLEKNGAEKLARETFRQRLTIPANGQVSQAGKMTTLNGQIIMFSDGQQRLRVKGKLLED